MSKIQKLICLVLWVTLTCNRCKPLILPDPAPALYQFDPNASTRWISFENPGGKPGAGGTENHGAKGHPCDDIPAHSKMVLMNFTGSGLIQRIWLTISDRSVYMCRGLIINMYWDGDTIPAVSAPIGDFFGLGFERKAPFENELFTSGEGRSFVCHIPMPFARAARIEVVNETDRNLDMLFYDIDLQSTAKAPDQFLYFHGYWHRDTSTELTVDFKILPEVKGKGRYLGTNISVIDNPLYEDAWWGEGEVKIYVNGETTATLVGTGTEDYIGTAWGQGVFQNRFAGCLTGDAIKRQWAFYRYHIPDPVFFQEACTVTIQQIGGNTKAKVQALLVRGIPLKPITVHRAPEFIHLYNPDSLADLSKPSLPDGWVNFYRTDDVAAMVYFYLDRTSSGLSPIQSIGERVYKMN